MLKKNSKNQKYKRHKEIGGTFKKYQRKYKY